MHDNVIKSWETVAHAPYSPNVGSASEFLLRDTNIDKHTCEKWGGWRVEESFASCPVQHYVQLSLPKACWDFIFTPMPVRPLSYMDIKEVKEKENYLESLCGKHTLTMIPQPHS